MPYCQCETPVMDIDHDAGCRRCGRPVDFSPGAEQRRRLEELRLEIRAERISYGELAELAELVEWIDPGDVELLEWAGVPEHH